MFFDLIWGSGNDELEILKRQGVDSEHKRATTEGRPYKRQDTDPEHTRANTEVCPYIRKPGEICESVDIMFIYQIYIC